MPKTAEKINLTIDGSKDQNKNNSLKFKVDLWKSTAYQVSFSLALNYGSIFWENFSNDAKERECLQ